MSPFIVFFAVVCLILAWPIFVMLRHTGLSISNIRSYLSKGGDGEGVVGGIAKFVLIVLALGALASINESNAYEHEWLNHAYVYGGVHRTEQISPMCYTSGASNRLTSTGGVGAELYRYGPFSLDAEYEHHSCAINRDKEGYDAWGFKAEYRFDLSNIFK